jgi:hypothetical protein
VRNGRTEDPNAALPYSPQGSAREGGSPPIVPVAAESFGGGDSRREFLHERYAYEELEHQRGEPRLALGFDS